MSTSIDNRSNSISLNDVSGFTPTNQSSTTSSSQNASTFDSGKSSFEIAKGGIDLTGGAGDKGLGQSIKNLLGQGLQHVKNYGHFFGDEFVNSLIRGMSTYASKADARDDGKMLGANGKLLPGNTSLDKVPGVTPQGGVRNNETIIYTNGILNDTATQAKDLQSIANATGSKVVGVRNATQGAFGDLTQCLGDKARLGNNKAAETLKFQILNELYKGHDVHLMGHSQGGLITARALFDVRDSLKAQGKSDAEVKNIMSRIQVETFGAASHSYPDGPKYDHYVNNTDLVPASFGLGTALDKNNKTLHPGEGANVHYFTDFKPNPMDDHNFADLYLKHRE